MSMEVTATSQQVIEAVRGIGLDGVIAKRRRSRYMPGDRNTDWVKLKLDRQQEFAVGRRGRLACWLPRRKASAISRQSSRRLYAAPSTRGVQPHQDGGD